MLSGSRCLIVGSDGMIGGALLASLLRHGIESVGATRRLPPKAHGVLLDLLGDPRDWQIPAETQVVVNCAAIAGAAACQRNSEDARKANCESVAALAHRCANESRLFVHISTDRVFSGRCPRARDSREFSPIDEYGRQKAAADKSLLMLYDEGASVAIVRFSKVV
ncbi:MAG TPA: sugar nucleotide-binding protein, partial [Pirellulales bacterium]|nr:sugar nucleotide-binding protein [Pirellulales bacterium]